MLLVMKCDSSKLDSYHKMHILRCSNLRQEGEYVPILDGWNETNMDASRKDTFAPLPNHSKVAQNLGCFPSCTFGIIEY